MTDAIKLASLGLSPTQLLSVGWEMIPFSFVADWVVDVGSWLRAWEPKPWILYLGSCVSVKTETTRISSGASVGMGYGTKPTQIPGATRCVVTQLDRTIETLTPPLAPPLTGEALSLSRQLDSMSLGWGMLSSFYSKFRRK